MSTLTANAKINIGLRILGRRPADGYHVLETIFQELAFGDRIVAEETTVSGGMELYCSDPAIPCDDNNLILKAVKAMRPFLPEDLHWRITLNKNIPPGAGLGGGSSDAAAMLKYLNRYARLEDRELFSLALGLGADVPFFLRGGTAYAQGIGEILRPVQIPRGWTAVLVFPGIHIPTSRAYRELRISLTEKVKKAIIPRRMEKNFSWQIFENDFERAIIPSYPEIGRIKRRLYELGAVHAALSGSGSTVFGICETCDTAERAAAAFDHAVTAEPIF